MTDFRAIVLILSAMFFFAVQDVVVKFTSGQVSLWQMQVIRSIAIIALIAVPLLALGRRSELLPICWRWPLVRAVFMSLAYLCFYTSLPYISLAKAASTFFISPMLITVFAAIFLSEPIGPRRIAAVIGGFAGVLLIVQPGLQGWSPAALLPVGAAIAYALGVILTRWQCQLDPGFSLTIVNALMNGVIGLAAILVLHFLGISESLRDQHSFVLSGWIDLSALVLGLVVLTAVTHIAGALASIRAYQIGEASRLAPFEYTYLVMMTLFGYAIWSDVPDTETMIGMMLICGSGTFIAWREGRPPRPIIQQTAELPWTPDHPEDEDGRPVNSMPESMRATPEVSDGHRSPPAAQV